MGGCLAYASPDAFVPLPGTTFVAPIPNSPSLVGGGFFCQAYVVDPPANRAGVTNSDRGDVVIGSR